jgi:hypothetical protein
MTLFRTFEQPPKIPRSVYDSHDSQSNYAESVQDEPGEDEPYMGDRIPRQSVSFADHSSYRLRSSSLSTSASRMRT